MHSKLETRNPELETRNSKPGTRNLELETRNLELETRNPEPGTWNSKLFTLIIKYHEKINLNSCSDAADGSFCTKIAR